MSPLIKLHSPATELSIRLYDLGDGNEVIGTGSRHGVTGRTASLT